MTGVEVIVLSVAAGVTIAAGTSYYLKRRRDKQLRKRLFGKPFSKFKQKRFDEDNGVLRSLSEWFAIVETKGLFSEGVYRISIKQQILKEMASFANQGKKIRYDKLDEPVHATACLIKKLFRDLPECLISFKLYPQLMDIQKNERDMDMWVKRMNEQLETLTYRNSKCLKRVLTHLYYLQSHSDKNLMTSKNLAVVFGPCLIFSHVPSDAMTFLNDCMDINSLVENLIIYESKILVDIQQPLSKKEQRKLDKDIVRHERIEQKRKRKEKEEAKIKAKNDKIAEDGRKSGESGRLLKRSNSLKRMLSHKKADSKTMSPRNKKLDLKTISSDSNTSDYSPRDGSSSESEEEEDDEEMRDIRARMEQGRSETIALSPEMLAEMRKNPFFVKPRNEDSPTQTEVTVDVSDDELDDMDDLLSPRSIRFADDAKIPPKREIEQYQAEEKEIVSEEVDGDVIAVKVLEDDQVSGNNDGDDGDDDDDDDDEFDFDMPPPSYPPPLPPTEVN
eukprot:TRINITY_DN6884_c0_g1_i1.p1 TRINITY_DN6884_c0_g1~~TRINITY_DN6884_c0_g1_i1.p1  ORF type:complete len:503 (+),score=168.80 TRINITY_DN6884_c0_g1_i1:150-1658(+)